MWLINIYGASAAKLIIFSVLAIFKASSFNFKTKISAVQCERKASRLISFKTLVSFRWTAPLSKIVRRSVIFNHTCRPCDRSDKFLDISTEVHQIKCNYLSERHHFYHVLTDNACWQCIFSWLL